MILTTGSPIDGSTSGTLGDAWALAAVLAYLAVALGHRFAAMACASVAWRTRLLWLAWGLHGGVLAANLGVGMEQVPRFGFGPALSITAWLALTVYWVESALLPQLKAHGALAALGAVAVLLAWAFPGAALHSHASAWLPLHWALGFASYGLFAAAAVHAWLMNRAERQIRQANAPQDGIALMTLERLMFRFVQGGFVLLTATLVAALGFSEQLYGAAGKAWRWDHKTVFSALSWLTFAVLLLGRAYFGWRGKLATRGVYLGAVLLLMAYVGSRFVLEVLLKRSL